VRKETTKFKPGKLGIDYPELKYRVLGTVLPPYLRTLWNFLDVRETSYICPGCGFLVVLKYKPWGSGIFILEEEHIYEGGV
jgi:hypothetical protein